MSPETPIATFAFASGSLRGTQLTLYGARLLHHGGDYMESMPLAAVAAVRVAYERHEQRIGGGVALILLALVLFVASGALRDFAAGAAAEVAGGQSIAELLRGALRVIEAFAGLLPVVGVACLAAAAALIVFGWIGTTTMVLMLPAAEREYAVRGQNRMLVDFAELLAERVAQRSH